MADPESFRDELAALINRHSRENRSNTPDFILADYLLVCLMAFDSASNQRARWYDGKGGNESDAAVAAIEALRKAGE